MNWTVLGFHILSHFAFLIAVILKYDAPTNLHKNNHIITVNIWQGNRLHLADTLEPYPVDEKMVALCCIIVGWSLTEHGHTISILFLPFLSTCSNPENIHFFNPTRQKILNELLSAAWFYNGTNHLISSYRFKFLSCNFSDCCQLNNVSISHS